MAQLQRMDARLDTFTTKLYQVNTRIGRIARRQAHLGGFVESPSPSLVAPEEENDGADSSGTSDGDEDSSSSIDDEMIAFQ